MKREKIKKAGFSLVLAILLVLFLLSLDWYVGVIYETRAPEFGIQNLALALNNENQILSQRTHPYLTYENTPNYYKGGVRQHNNLGYRNHNDTKLRKDSIRILVLGGSTTYGHGVHNPEDTWPAQLEDLLNSENGPEVEVINGGLGWATSAELLNHYVFRDRYLDSDIVILHTGLNDSHPLMQSKYNPEYTHWRYFKSGGANGLRPGEARLIKASNIVKFAYSIWYSRIGYSTPGAYVHTKISAKLQKEEVFNNVNANPATGFSRNLSMLIRNIVQDGAIPVYFQFYWPGKDLFSEGGEKALFVANKYTNFTKHFDARILALSKNEDAARKVTEAQGTKFIKMAEGSIPVKYFIDQSHLNVGGQKFKAEFVYRNILSHILKLDGN